MPTYRVYLLDKRQKIQTASWLPAADLGEATDFARLLFIPGVETIEVWIGPSRLAVLQPDQSADGAG